MSNDETRVLPGGEVVTIRTVQVECQPCEQAARVEVRMMAPDPSPPCLVCGRPMRVTAWM